MSLDKKSLQVVDTLDIQMFYKDATTGEKYCYASGETSDSSIAVSTEQITVQAGIGGQTTFSLNNNKTIEIDATVRMHDLELLALKNGVELNKNGKSSFTIDKPVELISGSGELDKIIRIMKITDDAQHQFKIVDTEPVSADEVKVEIVEGRATFTCQESVTRLYVTAEVKPKEGKDTYSIEFNAGSFAKNCEVLLNGVVYSAETSEIVADLYYNFTNCSVASDYTVEYGINSAVEIPIKLTVLKPKYLADGTLNTTNKLGELVIAER